MPIQIKNSEIIKKKRNQILGYFSLGEFKERAPE